MRTAFLTTYFLGLLVSTQALAQERQWSLDTVNNQVFLVFGVPESDDVGLSFWCNVGKSRIQAFLPETVAAIRAGENIKIDMDIDGHTEKIVAKVARDGGSQKLTVETTFGSAGSLMKTLMAGQTLRINVKGHISSFPIADADFGGLVDICNGIDPEG